MKSKESRIIDIPETAKQTQGHLVGKNGEIIREYNNPFFSHIAVCTYMLLFTFTSGCNSLYGHRQRFNSFLNMCLNEVHVSTMGIQFKHISE